MVLYSNIIFQEKKDEHIYTAFQLSYSSDREAFLQYILPVLKEEYGLGESFEQKTESLSDDRKEIMRGLMERYTNEIIPDFIVRDSLYLFTIAILRIHQACSQTYILSLHVYRTS